MRPRHTIWEQLWESTEGPTVTVQIPRQWAEELLRSIATALEIEDVGMDGEDDLSDEPHMEPDADDMGGPPDGDEDDMGLDLMPHGDDDDDVAAGDDDDEDDEEDDDDDEQEEEDEAYEATDPHQRDGMRPETALGESKFSRLAGKLGKEKGVKSPGGLAASIGRKKYGRAGMAKKSAAGRRK